MPPIFFQWSTWIFGVIGALIAVFGVYRVLRSPAIREKLGLSVTKSQRVDIAATDETAAKIKVAKSKDVNIKIED